MPPAGPAEARYAIYYAPGSADPLHAAGAAWLGRDVETGAPCRQPALADLAEITAAPRLYGFHATLKPPMRLRRDLDPARGYADLRRAAAALADRLTPFTLPPLAVTDLDGFLALCPTGPCPALHALADACVIGLDAWRAPPAAAELARRRAAGLSATTEKLLADWGYPYVLQAWRFHMTLSRRLTPAELARLRPAADAHFAAALARPRQLADICLFTQRAPGAAFLLAERLACRAPLSPGSGRPSIRDHLCA